MMQVTFEGLAIGNTMFMRRRSKISSTTKNQTSRFFYCIHSQQKFAGLMRTPLHLLFAGVPKHGEGLFCFALNRRFMLYDFQARATQCQFYLAHKQNRGTCLSRMSSYPFLIFCGRLIVDVCYAGLDKNALSDKRSSLQKSMLPTVAVVRLFSQTNPIVWDKTGE